MAEQQVSLDEAGQAESVVTRLIQERRALEHAAQVLQTYRMVRSQLQPAIDRLQGVEKSIEEAQERLKNVQAEEKAALDKAEQRVKSYEERRGAEALQNVEALQQQVVKLEAEVKALQEKRVVEEQQYQDLIDNSEAQLRQSRAALEDLRKQHGAVAEAIGRAASFFATP